MDYIFVEFNCCLKKQELTNVGCLSDHAQASAAAIRQTPPTRGSQLLAVRNYNSQYFDEMELKEGDVIAFMDELEEGWWRGMKLGNQSQVLMLYKLYKCADINR